MTDVYSALIRIVVRWMLCVGVDAVGWNGVA